MNHPTLTKTDYKTPFDQFRLAGRTAVVTGGSRGLGLNFARALAQADADVLIAARDETQLLASVAELREKYGLSVRALVVNLSDRVKTDAFAREAVDLLGRVDIFVGNAGTERCTFVDSTAGTDVDAILELNVTANIILTSHFARVMKANDWGRIIYISSVTSAISSTDGHGVYSASKAALEAYARTAAVELGLHRITVNCISPGVYLTDLPKQRLAAMDAEQARQIYTSYSNMTALGRWGDPTELDGPLLLLASEAGSYITGTTLHIDGGMPIRLRPV